MCEVAVARLSRSTRASGTNRATSPDAHYGHRGLRSLDAGLSAKTSVNHLSYFMSFLS